MVWFDNSPDNNVVDGAEFTMKICFLTRAKHFQLDELPESRSLLQLDSRPAEVEEHTFNI